MTDITIAASESAFQQLFIVLRDNFTFARSDSASFGPFSASYSLALHLEGGSLLLHNDNTIEIALVDIVFSSLSVELCFNLPGVPGFCIIPNPWNGCLLGFPGIGGPICVPLDLSGLVSEISEIRAGLDPRYYVDPGRAAGWSDLQAEFAGVPNLWQIYIDPTLVSVDPIDVPATIANMLENAVEAAIDNMLPSWLPGWAKDVIWFFIGPILDMVIGALGILDSVEDFFQDLLGNGFGLLSFIETAVADYFANQYPIYELEDPYPILPMSGTLIPVKIPIRNLTATVNTDEMVVEAEIG